MYSYHFDMGNFTAALVITLWYDNIGMALSLKVFTTIATFVFQACIHAENVSTERFDRFLGVSSVQLGLLLLDSGVSSRVTTGGWEHWIVSGEANIFSGSSSLKSMYSPFKILVESLEGTGGRF